MTWLVKDKALGEGPQDMQSTASSQGQRDSRRQADDVHCSCYFSNPVLRGSALAPYPGHLAIYDNGIQGPLIDNHAQSQSVFQYIFVMQQALLILWDVDFSEIKNFSIQRKVAKTSSLLQRFRKLWKLCHSFEPAL